MRDTATAPRRTSVCPRTFRRRISGAPGRRLSAVVAFTLGSAGLLPATGHADSPIMATNSWFRYILPRVPAGGYMTLQNTSNQAVV